ncbi:MAG: tRNA-dihydrouridine synthase, partial [Muribaculaceae bacterium]|nr:tRNA-dihydrouridine synthase [Muribaculaceae bacterium]
MKYYFAPVQGHTDAAYRQVHSEIYGNNTEYFTPFLRLEKDELRKKDLKDAQAALVPEPSTLPQVIFRDFNELSKLVNILKDSGHGRININMGCPFPLQTARGRGAATIARKECVDAVADVISKNPDILFSVKMRLGFKDENEWRYLIDVLNSLTLDHVAVHPRIATDQYSG